MTHVLFKTILLLIFFITVLVQDNLSQSDKCGTLNTNYFYNLKHVTEIDEFPWMGRIQYKNTSTGKLWIKCYAVLINEWFLLRSVDCFSDQQVPVNIILGDWNIGNTFKRSDCDNIGRCAPVPKIYKIEETIMHPNFNSETLENDIALVKLSQPVTYSPFIQPICLPSKDIVHRNFDNQHLELTGWFTNQTGDNFQAKSFVRVVNFNTCERMLRNFTVGSSKRIYKINKENSICALSCIGDDNNYSINSVLMGTTEVDAEPANYFLIGMSVFRPKKCTASKAHVFIRIDRYLEWIYDNINLNISLIKPRK